MHTKRQGKETNTSAQLTLLLTGDVLRDEARRNEVVALLARLLLQSAPVREGVEATDDAS